MANIPQLSPNAPVPVPVQTKEAAKTDTQAAAAGTADPKPVQKARTDTVTITKQAAQLASQLYSPQEEARETPTQKAVESAQGKK